MKTFDQTIKFTIQKTDEGNWIGMIHEGAVTFSNFADTVFQNSNGTVVGGDTIYTLMMNVAKAVIEGLSDKPKSNLEKLYIEMRDASVRYDRVVNDDNVGLLAAQRVQYDIDWRRAYKAKVDTEIAYQIALEAYLKDSK